MIWAIRTVLKPREMPKAIKASIREIPVTISEFSIGILFIDMTMLRGSCRMLRMPMAAAVPRMVATRAEIRAIRSVLFRALMMARSANIPEYHLVVKPPQRVRDFVLLKESTIMVKIGAYRKMTTRAM